MWRAWVGVAFAFCFLVVVVGVLRGGQTCSVMGRRATSPSPLRPTSAHTHAGPSRMAARLVHAVAHRTAPAGSHPLRLVGRGKGEWMALE